MAASVRKTFQEMLRPTPPRRRRWTWCYGAAAHSATPRSNSNIMLYRQRGVCVSRYAQEAEPKDLRAAFPD